MVLEKIFKVLTIDEQGDHVGYVTQLICINFDSHFPSSFHMNSGSKLPKRFLRKTSFNFEI